MSEYRLVRMMPRNLRYLPEGSLVEVTVRTVHGRFLLRPSPKLNDRIVGVLAKAQAATGMKICAFIYLSNHAHLLLRPEDAEQLARFMAYANSNIAREAGRLHGWKERFWGRRYSHSVISDEPEVQQSRLRYLLSQGVKERLVASPHHWPGASSTQTLSRGEPLEGEWIDRTEQYRAGRRGEPNPSLRFASRHALELAPLPCWDELDPNARRTRVRRLIREIEEEHEARGTVFFGREAILEQNPLDRPAVFHRSPAPRFHAARPRVRRALEWAYCLFRIEYSQASRDYRAGRRAEFPARSFRPVAFLAAGGRLGPG